MDFIPEPFLSIILAVGAALIPALASFHIISSKEDVRSAIGWTGLVWLVPFFGAVLYLLFGINRIKRKAVRVRRERGRQRQTGARVALPHPNLVQLIADAAPDMVAQAHMMDRVVDLPLSAGNRITPLEGGDVAFPDMLAAIGRAEKSVALATFIFDLDRAGEQFVDALAEATERGVDVRVLVDGVGELYHIPSITRTLRKRGVRIVLFNRRAIPWRMSYLNLRNHRKLLIVDGQTGYTGGMNIRQGNFEESASSDAIRDIHFRLDGPVVRQLMEVFAEDWSFAAEEDLDDQVWFPADLPDDKGPAVARGIPDGPDEDTNRVKWAMISALGMARRQVRIVTPYFLPDRILVSALNHAALRGVDVRIYLPQTSNLRVVGWASRAQYAQVLEGGCRVFLTPPPFDHSKIMLVDSSWLLFGSSNWDPRSLRLNFEFNVECYDEGLAAHLAQSAVARETTAHEVTYEEAQSTSALVRARNGIAWLFSPYL